MQHLDPNAAHAFLQQTPEAVLVDCRTEIEHMYVGHPVGAEHVAWQEAPDWEIDPDFARKVGRLVKGDLSSAESHRKFYDEYNAVLDMPAEYYLDTIRTVFQQHLLPRGLWDVAGERVDPSKIRGCALLTIEGELDDISGQGQTRAAHALCTGIADEDRKHLTVAGAGHYGIFSGRRWRTQVYPQVRDFIAAHAGKPAVPATGPQPAKKAAPRR